MSMAVKLENETFPSPIGLNVHVRTHAGEQPLECANVHHELKPHACQLCSYSSAKASDMTRHVTAVHHELKPHACQLCSYSSAKASDMTRHVTAVHHGIKPHACQLCNYSSAKASDMTRHVTAVHHGIKPHACQLCNYSSARASTLAKHVAAVHYGLKPHVCQLCNYSSAAASDMTRHVTAVHHGIKRKSRDQSATITTAPAAMKAGSAPSNASKRKRTSSPTPAVDNGAEDESAKKNKDKTEKRRTTASFATTSSSSVAPSSVAPSSVVPIEMMELEPVLEHAVPLPDLTTQVQKVRSEQAPHATAALSGEANAASGLRSTSSPEEPPRALPVAPTSAAIAKPAGIAQSSASPSKESHRVLRNFVSSATCSGCGPSTSSSTSTKPESMCWACNRARLLKEQRALAVELARVGEELRARDLGEQARVLEEL